MLTARSNHVRGSELCGEFRLKAKYRYNRGLLEVREIEKVVENSVNGIIVSFSERSPQVSVFDYLQS